MPISNYRFYSRVALAQKMIQTTNNYKSEGFRDGTGLQVPCTYASGSNNTAPLPNNHPYISSCKLQLAEISTAATCAYVGMVMCEWYCVITVTLYVYFTDQCHPYCYFYITCCTCTCCYVQLCLCTLSLPLHSSPVLWRDEAVQEVS